ncbi:hypothetical protein K443DRAFT_106566 [Laccaria amethystina LaAM-08-1]|uniref:tRNA (adenine(58)-N(1))-methyltransferase catalytic subunit TRM61 n=1 Tax=Laccaria amethystina LaAM-08-1 TaxID=1095629 RepID=A0A0C9WL06_9AGAR|nr:hypothetical protein K443DRAFT_106566 [Laccaria amethystina LaAM-08-1]
MWSTAPTVAAGDTVIIWLTRDQIQPLVITPGKDFNSKFGNYRQADFVGVPYGSKVFAKTGKGFLHILRPTPELWTIALPHRTQILYIADIAFITSYLNITRGSRVIEAGTGSGSFSHSIARTIGSAGHLYSYEFHEARASKARDEFTRHGMNDIVSLTHRNVIKDGFTVVDEVDAVFLDLPAPWEAVEHAKKALRKDRTTRICCFSPCMEQVLRTVSALNESGFTEITMYETLLRPHEVYTYPPLQDIYSIGEKLKKAEAKREEQRLKQIAGNRASASASGLTFYSSSSSSSGPTTNRRTAAQKRKREEEDVNEGEEEEVVDKMVVVVDEQDLHPEEGGEVEPKRVRLDDEEDVVLDDFVPTLVATPTMTSTNASVRMGVSKASSEVRGHTSYLTFACLIPFSPPVKEGVQEEGDAGMSIQVKEEVTIEADI